MVFVVILAVALIAAAIVITMRLDMGWPIPVLLCTMRRSTRIQVR